MTITLVKIRPLTPLVAMHELLSVLHEQSDLVQPSKHLQIPHSHLPLPAQTTLK